MLANTKYLLDADGSKRESFMADPHELEQHIGRNPEGNELALLEWWTAEQEFPKVTSLEEAYDIFTAIPGEAMDPLRAEQELEPAIAFLSAMSRLGDDRSEVSSELLEGCHFFMERFLGLARSGYDSAQARDEAFGVREAWNYSGAVRQYQKMQAEGKAYEAGLFLEMVEYSRRALNAKFETSLQQQEQEAREAEELVYFEADAAWHQLLGHAAFVQGMPFDTPLRWQKVGTRSNIDGAASKYVMANFGDGRRLTIDKNLELTDLYELEWRIKFSHTVGDQGHRISTEIKKSRAYGTNTESVLWTANEGAVVALVAGSGTPELQAARALMKEAVEVLPAKQAAFMNQLRVE